MKEVDYLVVGGGIFGVYTALYLAGKNYTVCLLEKEEGIFMKASIVNQARLHEGYHYPRALSTALMALEHKDRFTHEHQSFINTQFESYYAIDKYGSFTNSHQFEQFCNSIHIPVKKVKQQALFNFDRIEELYLTHEYTFDPVLIAEFYKNKLFDNKNIITLLHAKIMHAEKMNGHWDVQYTLNTSAVLQSIKAHAVINATYAGTNGINTIFGMKKIELMYQISEIALVNSPQLQNTGITIMDGPFASILPYGLSGLLALSSVPYTHHKVSHDPLPVFDCQQLNKSCHPDFISNCNSCPARPESNQSQMIHQIKTYLSDEVTMEYMHSLYTIKTKLMSSLIDDGRPTEISKMSAHPDYYCLFSGKINSIYEIEKLIST